MKYYLDPATQTRYAFEGDGSQDDFIDKKLVPITEAQADAMYAAEVAAEPVVKPFEFFLSMCSESEQIGLVTAAMSVPVVKLWYDRMLASGCVTITDRRAVAGLDALVSAGLLTAERKQTIFTAMS